MLKKINRLKKKKEFNFIYKKGEVLHSSSFSIHFVRAYKPYAQIGISVSKHVGISVIRSRVKRIISEACRLNIEHFAVKNYVITARENAKEKTSVEIENEILRVLKKHNLYVENSKSTKISSEKTKANTDTNLKPTSQKPGEGNV